MVPQFGVPHVGYSFFGAALFVLLFGAPARAQCMMDTECKRDRICEEGSCVAPRPPPPQLPIAPRPQVQPQLQPQAQAEPLPSPPLVRHSGEMMTVGIGGIALAGVGVIVALRGLGEDFLCGFGNSWVGKNDACNAGDPYIYGGLVSAALLAGVGVPLFVVGAHKEPASPEAPRVAPWVGRQSAGLSLRLPL